MWYLEGKNLVNAQPFIDLAIAEARKSVCAKSQRGAVVVLDDVVLGKGSNNPPAPLLCVPNICYNICRLYTIHAEQKAMFEALKAGSSLAESRVYHIKIKEGIVTPVPKPDEKSCIHCSRVALEFGLAEYVLQHAEGFAVYPVLEFHQRTLSSLSTGL